MNEKERERLGECAMVIDCGFAWDDTPEGHDFWSYVVSRLERMAKTGRLGFEEKLEKPERRVPTDEDARKRPEAKFWDYDRGDSYVGRLVAVLDRDRYAFVSENGGSWHHCELLGDDQ